MQIGDNLHEMSKLFLGKIRKKIKISSAEFFTRNAKR